MRCDVLLSIEEIEMFFCDRPRRYDTYISDICLKRAVERNTTIIGEAVNRLLKVAPQTDITSARSIVDTRNYVIHGYDSVTDEIIWGIIVRHIPLLKKEVLTLLEQRFDE